MMWELIAANRRKSLVLFVGMAVVLCGLGYLIGYVVHPDGGGMLGLILAVGVWMVLSLVTLFGGGGLVLGWSRAREVTPDIHPQLHNVVEEMKIAAGLTKMPKIYIIDEKAPNAFATGLSADDSAICVTAGLLTRLNRDELQGVIAHETSHIMNRDVQFMTTAGIMLGSIVVLSEVFLRGMWLTGGGSSRRYRSSKGGGGVQPALMVAAIALAILGPIFARLFYFGISRKREYLADACGARLSRYPEGLASALEKIAGSNLSLDAANKVTAPMYIISPLRAHGGSLSHWDSTHPPMEERVRILRSMGDGASLLSYQRAFSKVRGKATTLIPGSGLQKDEKVTVRDAHPDVVKEETAKANTRNVMDLMRAVNGFAFLLCACGLKIKVPPEFSDPQIKCPRCGVENEIPRAEVSDLTEVAAVVGAMVGAGAALPKGDAIPRATPIPDSATFPEEAPLQYARRDTGWESFTCACGNLLQISPAFTGTQLSCAKCGRITRIQ